jgi:hypothetical protein
MEREQNIFDKLGSIIPEYNGYSEREGRRNCDKILREKIFSHLSKIENRLEIMIQEHIISKNIDMAKRIEQNRKIINTLSSKIKYAPYGASGFFNDSQLKEKELLLIYKMDLELAEISKRIEQKIFYNNMSDFEAEIQKFGDQLDYRNQYIKDYK